MHTQREELLSQLSEHGWRVTQEESELEWWADEMWQLESVWSPVVRLRMSRFWLIRRLVAIVRRPGYLGGCSLATQTS